MQRGLVSVLMPVLNEARHIETTITAVLDQRDVDLELIVLDGGSLDDTRAIVGSIADPRIRLLDNRGISIPNGLNAGLAAARGEFVARVDGHGTVEPDYLARGVARLAADPRLVGVGGLRTGTGSTPVGQAIALALSSPFGVGNSVNHYASEYQLTDHVSFGVYRAAALREIGGWDPGLAVNEDVDCDLRLLRAGGLLGFDPAMRLHWRSQESLLGLARQYRRYGRGKAAMIRKNGVSAMRARHFVAPAMVAATAGTLAAAAVRPRVLALAVPYLAAVGVAARHTARDQRRVPMPALAGAFLAMHFGWGLGFWEGLAGLAPRRASGGVRSRFEPGRRSTAGVSR